MGNAWENMGKYRKMWENMGKLQENIGNLREDLQNHWLITDDDDKIYRKISKNLQNHHLITDDNSKMAGTGGLIGHPNGCSPCTEVRCF